MARRERQRSTLTDFILFFLMGAGSLLSWFAFEGIVTWDELKSLLP